MNPDHEKNEKELFAETLEKKPDARAAYLDDVCGSDHELKARIQKLLDAHDAASGFLEEPLGGATSAGMDRLGRFRILRELGRGGQGAVYLAEDEKLHRRVALKVLPSGSDLTPHILERFKREAEAASRLDHPGICSVFETGELEGLHYIVMRFVEGESLAKKIAIARKEPSRFKGGVFETADSSQDCSGKTRDSSSSGTDISRHDAFMKTLSCIEKAAVALHTAHEAGIVHRDIKPGNIMVTLEEDPVILDFGLARLEESDGINLTRSTDLLGTPAYMSPEQIRGDRKKIDRQTDIYSLAATLIECLTLRPPFEAPTREGLYRAILTEEPQDPRNINPRIPSDLSVILQTALAKNPDHRYKTAMDFAEELRRIRLHEPILTRRAGPWLRLWRWSQRNPRLAAAMAGIFLVLVLGFVVSTYQFGKTQFELKEKERNADIWLLPYLQHAAKENLWPALPHKVGEMKNWLEKAETLYGRLEIHQQWLETMRTDYANRLQDQDLEDEVSSMESFVGQLRGFDMLIREVKERLESAANIEARSIVQHHEEWKATIEAIADEAENPHYRGLIIEPRIGMVPLGKNSESNLFEFAHLQTGAPPEGDAVTGQLEIAEETGMVFVLIPGGDFYMGSLPGAASKENPEDIPYIYTKALGTEFPLNPVSLGPFFLSKYEMTQGQWLRATGENPSHYDPGSRHSSFETGADLRNSVESVCWDDCERTLHRLGMVLPSEAQWEYACRAGTTTPWYTGDTPQSLAGYENIADEGSRKAYSKAWEFTEGIFDGFIATAQVGRFQPNPFGLHDMLGNVSEWVRDRWRPYGADIFGNEGERIIRDADWNSKFHVYRGGSFRHKAFFARSAVRNGVLPRLLNHTVGLRPAMQLEQKRSNDDVPKATPSAQREDLKAICNRADHHLIQGRYSEAQPLFRTLLEKHRQIYGEEHPRTLFTWECLAWALMHQGSYSESKRHYQGIMEIRFRLLGDKHYATLRTMDHLAKTFLECGQYSEAELLFHRVNKGFLRLFGDKHKYNLNSLYSLSAVLLKQGKYVEAEPLCTRLWACVHTLKEEDGFTEKDLRKYTRDSLQLLVELYESSDQPEKADAFRALLPDETDPSTSGVK